MFTIILVGFYLLCAILVFGLDFAKFHRKYPKSAKEHLYKDFKYALLVSLLGPGALIYKIFFGIDEMDYGIKFSVKSEYDEYGNKLYE